MASLAGPQSPSSLAPFGKLRPLRAESGVGPVAWVHDSGVGESVEEPLRHVSQEAVEGFGGLCLTHATGEEAVAGEKVGCVTYGGRESYGTGCMAAEMDHFKSDVANGERVAVLYRC